MAVRFTQNQIDSAVAYLMSGGPDGEELTTGQFRDTVFQARKPQYPGSILSDFAWQIQLAINQGHRGISNSHNLCRDKWGVLSDVFQANPDNPAGGIAANEIALFDVSVSG